MSLMLCSDERILKSWTFASDETTVGNKTYNLTVTNKRIISTNSSPQSISRTELPLSSVKGITGSYSKNSEERANPKRGLIVLGIVLLLAGIILIAACINEVPAVIAGAVLAIGGLIITVYGGAHSNTVTTFAGFKLIITTYGQETSSLAIGKQFASSDAQTTISVTHITLNEAAAYEIIDMLGALVMGQNELLHTQSRGQSATQLSMEDGFDALAESETALTK